MAPIDAESTITLTTYDGRLIVRCLRDVSREPMKVQMEREGWEFFKHHAIKREPQFDTIIPKHLITGVLKF